MGWWCGTCVGSLPYGEPTLFWPKGGEVCINCGKVHVPIDPEFKEWAMNTQLPSCVNERGVTLEDGRRYIQFGNLHGLLSAITGWSAAKQRELARATMELEKLKKRIASLTEEDL